MLWHLGPRWCWTTPRLAGRRRTCRPCRPVNYFVQAVLNRYETFILPTGACSNCRRTRARASIGVPSPAICIPSRCWCTSIVLMRKRTALLLDSQVAAIVPKTDTQFVQACEDPQRIAVESSGAVTCTSARTCCCRKTSTNIRKPTIRSWCFTDTIR